MSKRAAAKLLRINTILPPDLQAIHEAKMAQAFNSHNLLGFFKEEGDEVSAELTAVFSATRRPPESTFKLLNEACITAARLLESHMHTTEECLYPLGLISPLNTDFLNYRSLFSPMDLVGGDVREVECSL